MARDYTWSRRSVPAKMNTLGELGRLLGLGRHQTLRRLKASGLPYRTYIRRWQGPDGKWFTRKATGIPQRTAGELVKQNLLKSLGLNWKSFCRETKSKNPEPPPPLKDLMNSIRDIRTDRPECSLYHPRPIRLRKPPKAFKIKLRIKKR